VELVEVAVASLGAKPQATAKRIMRPLKQFHQAIGNVYRSCSDYKMTFSEDEKEATFTSGNLTYVTIKNHNRYER